MAESTKERVRLAAKKFGYRHNPLTGTLMSELRQSRATRFRGVIAVIEFLEPERPAHGPFHLELLRGATARAIDLGFKVDEYIANHRGLTLARIDSILQSRGIHGVILLPTWETTDFSALQWERYAGVYADYNRVIPPLHSVCCDHFQSTLVALETVRRLGYLRPGICIERVRNQRLERRYTAALAAFYEEEPNGSPVSPLITENIARAEFETWFRRFRPDVVICHHPEALEWMEACGASVPTTHGFVSLNLASTSRPLAGLDFQPFELGARATELVVAQLQRNERGVPNVPTRSTLPCRWVEGPTVRNVTLRELTRG